MVEVKYFAIDANNQELVRAIERCQNSTYEMDAELFEKRNESFTRNGLASTFLIGNLVEDPQPMIDPLTKHNKPKPNTDTPDYIGDKDYVYMATFCYETDVYWDHQTNKRHANNNYIKLVFAAKGAKFAISHYRKGDGLVLSGYLRSLRQDNPEDGRMRVNAQFLVVTDFSANPGTHIRREINEKFGKNTKPNKRYNSIQEVLADRSLSVDQQNELIAQMARSQYANNNSQNTAQSNARPTETQSQNTKSNDQEQESMDSLIPPASENFNFDISDDELSSAFDGEFN